MQVFRVSSLFSVCCFAVLATHRVNGGAFLETEAIKAGFESVHKVISNPNVHFKEEFNKDVEMLKALNNDAAQAVGNKVIFGLLGLLRRSDRIKDLIEIMGFTFMLFNARSVGHGIKLTATEKVNRETQFENLFLNNVLAKGPVLGIGTSSIWNENWDYYMMTFYRGNQILDRFMEILNGEMLISASGTVRAMTLYEHHTKGKKMKPEDAETFANYTLIIMPCNKSQNPESLLLAALQNLQSKSKQNLYELLENTSLKYENHVDKAAVTGATKLSYGFALWETDECAYLGIFYTIVCDSVFGIQNDVFPVPPSTCKNKIPQLDLSAKLPINTATGGHIDLAVKRYNTTKKQGERTREDEEDAEEEGETEGEGEEEEEEEEESQERQYNGKQSAQSDKDAIGRGGVPQAQQQSGEGANGRLTEHPTQIEPTNRFRSLSAPPAYGTKNAAENKQPSEAKTTLGKTQSAGEFTQDKTETKEQSPLPPHKSSDVSDKANSRVETGNNTAAVSVPEREPKVNIGTTPPMPQNYSQPEVKHEEDKQSNVKVELVKAVYYLINDIRRKAGAHLKKHLYAYKGDFTPAQAKDLAPAYIGRFNYFRFSTRHEPLAELYGNYTDEDRASRLLLISVNRDQADNVGGFMKIARPLLEKPRRCYKAIEDKSGQKFNVTRKEVISVTVDVNLESTTNIYVGVILELVQKQ